MNSAASRSAARLGLSTRQLVARATPLSRCLSSSTYTPPPSASSAPPRRSPAPPREEGRPQREGGGSYSRERGPQREGAGSYNRERGPQREGTGSYNRERGPQREGAGSYNRERGPQREGAGSYNRDRGPQRDGDSYGERKSQRERGAQREGGGGSYRERGPPREERRSFADRVPPRERDSGDTLGPTKEKRSWQRPEDTGSHKPQSIHKPRSTIIPGTIAPQLSADEVAAVYSQELFVFRCDVTATQIPAAMSSYSQLSELGVLSASDISNIARQIHARYRIDKVKEDVLPHIKTIIEDLKADKIPGHPLASVHLLSCLKDMEDFNLSNEFWSWLVQQDENQCDARTYGAAIECLAYQGIAIKEMEDLWEQALVRYSTTTVTSVAMNTGRGVPVMLLQGIITARLFHGNWRAAYEGFDICTRLYPTLTPPRIYELFIYERPVKEAYIVFLMACRAGTPPKPGVLTPLLKEIWLNTRDARAMIRLVYSFVGAGGTPNAIHLNSLIGGILGSFPRDLMPGDPEYDSLFKGTLNLVRSLISAFSRMGVPPTPALFNTIISVGGKLKREDLVHSGLQELLGSGLKPTMVTYRTLVNAVGELEDKSLLESSWEMLKKARLDQKLPWDTMDWKALIKACVGTGRVDYFRSELEKQKLDVGYEFFRKISSFMSRAAFPGRPVKPSENTTCKPQTKETLEKEVWRLADVFGSNRIQDFATLSSPAGEALFDLLPADGSPVGVTLSPEQATELEEIYKKLAVPPSVIDVENVGAAGGTGSSTGYDVAGLRFENWKAVNRLLFEAEWFEIDEERRRIKASREGVPVSEVENTKENIGYEFRFWNEDKAKRRICGEVDQVVSGRETFAEGWRGKEMQVRGRLGATPNGRT